MLPSHPLREALHNEVHARPYERLTAPLLLSRGDWSAFVTRPLSASLLAGAALLILIVLLPSISKKREATFQEE